MARASSRVQENAKVVPMKMSRLRKLVTGTLGSEIAEAALVLPIFFMIMLGIYWFGRAFNVYATINHAAREGARAAASPTCARALALSPRLPSGISCQPNPDQVAAVVKQALQASSLDPGQVTNLGTYPHCVRRRDGELPNTQRAATPISASTITCNFPVLCPPVRERPIAEFLCNSNIPINFPYRSLP